MIDEGKLRMARYLSEEVIDSIFSYHAPQGEEIKIAHEDVREKCRELAHWLNEHLPACPESTLAIRSLQEVMMYGNSALAQHGLPKEI